MFKDLDTMDARQFKALTGMTREAFDKLLILFTASYEEIKLEAYERDRAERQRKPGGGQKGRLDTMEKKLFFILYYLKVYPTFDVLGDRFDLDRSKACTNVHNLLPVLLRALGKAGVLPTRHFETVEEMQAAFADITDLFIDATERSRQRPQDTQTQQEHYSGKKKRHTVKNTVLANVRQKILFLGYTVAGSISSTSDTDYYRVNINAGSTLGVLLTPPSGANYDVYIYNSAGTQVASSTLGTGQVDSTSVRNNGSTTALSVT